RDDDGPVRRGAGPRAGAGPMSRPRVLFVAEAVTLAHVARPFALARGLDPGRYEAILAVDPRYQALCHDHRLATRPIRSLPSAQSLQPRPGAPPITDAGTVRPSARDALDWIRDVKRAAVAGDFRLSLSVPPRAAGAPSLTTTTPYWTPSARRRFPMPDLPLSR